MSTIILADNLPDLFTTLSDGQFEIRPLAQPTEYDLLAAVGIVTYGHSLRGRAATGPLPPAPRRKQPWRWRGSH